MGDSLQELADAFAHRAEEAERAEESIRTAMFDEMEVDYTADDEIEALGAKVVLDVMEADADANTILATNLEGNLTTPHLELGSPREARPLG